MPQLLCMKLELVLFKQKNQHESSEHVLKLKSLKMLLGS